MSSQPLARTLSQILSSVPPTDPLILDVIVRTHWLTAGAIFELLLECETADQLAHLINAMSGELVSRAERLQHEHRGLRALP